MNVDMTTLKAIRKVRKKRALVLTGERDGQTLTYLLRMRRYDWGLLIRPAMYGLLNLDGAYWVILDIGLREQLTALCLKFGGVTHE